MRAAEIIAAVAVASVAMVGYLIGLEAAAIGLGLWAVAVTALALGQRVGEQTPSRVAPTPTPVISEPQNEQPPDLRRLVWGAIGLRLIVGVIANVTGFNLKVAPDSAGYVYYGRMLANAWKNPAFDLDAVVGFNPRSFYTILNAAPFYFVDVDPTYVLSALNALVGVFAAWTASRLAFHLYGSLAARRTFVIAAFLPSIVLWTSINLRDAWSFAILMGSLLSAQVLRERFSVARLATMIGCFAAMPFVRGYLVPVVGLGIVASYMIVRVRRLPAALLSLAGLLIFFTVLAEQFGVSLTPDIEERLQTAERLRNGLAYGASAFDTSASIATPAGALSYLPIGVANFLLSPFPWRISSWRQVMALPETFLIYFLLFQAARGAIRGVRERLADIVMVLFVTLALTFAYGLVEGNEGTAYRHRAHVLFLIAVMAGGDHARKALERRAPRTASGLAVPTEA